MNNVSLHPTDCFYENFKQYSSSSDDFIPQDFDSRDQKKWSVAVEIVRNFFKDTANVSNSNLVRNANKMMSTLRHASNDIRWVGPTR